MTASSRFSDASSPRARLVVLEGMPGAGKTTTATALVALGYSVVGEYTDGSAATITITAHPDVADDDAHQANWLRKAAQCATRLARCPVVCADRDWLSSLSYAYSTAPADGGELLARRAAWAARHLRDGTLLLPAAYAIFDLAPAASLTRRAARLRPGHPWNHPQALERLRAFYRDPASCIRPASAEVASALGIPARLDLSGDQAPRAVTERLASLAGAPA
jgi:predicted ATPase